MRVLALDTTTRAGSAALVDGDRIVDERAGDAARSHGERLPGELIELLATNRVAAADVDLFAIASGPGSFTGLRIGIATIQGLAFVTRRRVVGVPALDALAQLASRDAGPGGIVAAWMDAHRREVFAALYRVSSAALFEPARLIPLDPPSVGDPASILARWHGDRLEPIVFAGDGAVMYADAIAGTYPSARILPPPLLAGAVGRVAAIRAANGEAVDPAGIQPLYVRRPDAELARERSGQSPDAA